MKESDLGQYVERMESAFRTAIPKIQNVLGARIKSGLTGPQFYILRLIFQKGALTVSELANILYVKPSAITSMIDRLLKHGLVVRERDENDRRLVFIHITDLGRETFEMAERNRKKVLEYYFSYLPEEELDSMVRAYEKLAGIVSRVDPPNHLE